EHRTQRHRAIESVLLERATECIVASRGVSRGGWLVELVLFRCAREVTREIGPTSRSLSIVVGQAANDPIGAVFDRVGFVEDGDRSSESVDVRLSFVVRIDG